MITEASNRLIILLRLFIAGVTAKQINHAERLLGDLSLIEPTAYFAKELQKALPNLKAKILQTIHSTETDQILDHSLRWLDSSKSHHIITLFDSTYPQSLKQISSPPLLLFINSSDISVLNVPQIAIVGSREPSISGKENAAHFSQGLAKEGWVITSGIAKGIDAIAHESALQEHKTIAVIGSGIDHFYPKINMHLYEAIPEQGAIVSHFPIGTPPMGRNFPRRNSIITGMSRGILIIEAGLKSGSLVSAYLALQQNRDVFAIPGSIKNPLAEGCHQLIQQGAKLVTDIHHITDELQYQEHLVFSSEDTTETGYSQPLPNNRPDDTLLINEHDQNILNVIRFDPTSLDEIALHTQLPIPIITTSLLDLEMNEYISKAGGGKYIRL